MFKELIRGKRVAIVGPAAYMEGTGLGHEIDDHDVVVRINRSIETCDIYGEDVGERTDILYSCLIETAANGGKVDIGGWKEKGVQLVVAPPNSTFEGVATSNTLHPMVNQATAKRIEKEIGLRVVDYTFHTWLAGMVKSRPNTGYLAIWDLAVHVPKQLSIYGFSFYLDGFLPGCKSGVKEEIGLTEKQFADKAFNSKRHNQKNMWEFMKRAFPRSFNNFDPILEAILNLPELDRKLFEDLMK